MAILMEVMGPLKSKRNQELWNLIKPQKTSVHDPKQSDPKVLKEDAPKLPEISKKSNYKIWGTVFMGKSHNSPFKNNSAFQTHQYSW